MELEQTNSVGSVSFLKRISWGAVLAGVVVALALQLVLSLLGIGIGAATIDPLQEQNPVSGLAGPSAIWFGVSILLAMTAGGWVAGRMSGSLHKTDGAIHGLLTWGLASLVLLSLINSAIGTVIGGGLNLVGKGASAVGAGISNMAPSVAEMARQQTAGIDLSEISNDVSQLLRDTGKAELQPENLRREAETAANEAGATAQQSGGNLSDPEFNTIITRVFSRGDAVLQAADKEALVNVVVKRTNLTRPEAEARVDQWAATAQVAKQKYEEMKVTAERKAREVGDKAAAALSRASLLSSLILTLGALAAAFAAVRALYTDVVVTEKTETKIRGPLSQRPVH